MFWEFFEKRVRKQHGSMCCSSVCSLSLQEAVYVKQKEREKERRKRARSPREAELMMKEKEEEREAWEWDDVGCEA